MSLNEAIDFILTVIHYKLLGVLSATSSVMMVMLFTWIFEFVWICSVVLTHWGLDKMATISQTTLSNAFSWMKMLEFRLRVHWNLFLRVQLMIFPHWWRQWLGADQATSHYLNQRWKVYWRIYASLGLNELTNVLDKIILVTVGFCMIGTRKL